MGFFLQGLTLGLAYVAPIGMQNLFVIDSALRNPRRRALLTALIVLFFDITLSLSCFFGIGQLMQRHEWLRLGVLAVGGLLVLRIGAGLLFAKNTQPNTTGRQSQDSHDDNANTVADTISTRFGGNSETLRTVITAGVVTWLNPQAIIDGTLMLGAFSATLTSSQSAPFITGVETASALWFFGLTMLISAFSSKINNKVAAAMNRICGVVVMAYGVKLLADFAIAFL